MKQRLIESYGGDEVLSYDALLKDCLRYGKALGEYAADTSLLLQEALADGKKVLFEGAQGTHLDIDHGIYPYGTSSNVVAAAAAVGSGIGFRHITEIIGVVKAFTSRALGPSLRSFRKTRLATSGTDLWASTEPQPDVLAAWDGWMPSWSASQFGSTLRTTWR